MEEARRKQHKHLKDHRHESSQREGRIVAGAAFGTGRAISLLLSREGASVSVIVSCSGCPTGIPHHSSCNSPAAIRAALYSVTAVLTEAMTNNAAVVLMAPIAILSTVGLDVDPEPVLIAVTFAASTSLATPVGYQTNTMVYTIALCRFVTSWP